MTALDLIDIIKDNEFIIYGNGYIAKRFFAQLKKRGYDSHVKAIAISTVPLSSTGTGGKPLVSITAISKKSLVLIAAHDVIANEMKRTLRKLKIENVIHVYPYLFEIELGEPLKRDCKIAIKVLLKRISKSYTPAIYYLTLKDYCNANKYNGSLYLKLMAHYTTDEAAARRWINFRKKIEECIQKGFRQDGNVKVLENYNLIDGLHRLVLATYFGQSVMKADVYGGTNDFYSKDGIGGGILIREEELIKYYTPEEIVDIKHADEELKEKIILR